MLLCCRQGIPCPSQTELRRARKGMSMQLNCKSTVVSCRVFLSSEFLYVAYRKLLGLLSLEVFEVQLDFSHVGIQVARWYNLLGARNEPFLIVCAIEQDRNSFFQSGLSERVPSGVMQRQKWSRLRASSARLSVMLVCLLRHTGIPPILRKMGPNGQKNHSFFIRKLLLIPSA